MVRLNRADEARRTMMELIELEPRFSLAGERSYRRFGDSPLMAQYLRDLAAAGAPDAAADAGARMKKAIPTFRRDSAA